MRARSTDISSLVLEFLSEDARALSHQFETFARQVRPAFS
jgi:transcriptional regulator with PAS, ATPase and Fis domain